MGNKQSASELDSARPGNTTRQMSASASSARRSQRSSSPFLSSSLNSEASGRSNRFFLQAVDDSRQRERSESSELRFFWDDDYLVRLHRAMAGTRDRRRNHPEQSAERSRTYECPVCEITIAAERFNIHLQECLTKPRINYNEDVLSCDRGECSICLEELVSGDTVARLPCLCIYHKHCIDDWFHRNRSCPEHPEFRTTEH